MVYLSIKYLFSKIRDISMKILRQTSLVSISKEDGSYHDK